MARALRIQFPGAFYHITCRGNERRPVFMDDEDRVRFLAFLRNSLKTYQTKLNAYILMNNHFHLLIQTMRANLSEFMRHFNICYTGWFNYQHHRSGHLYQGRYKAFLIDVDNYLLEVSRYLHLNIVRVSRLKQGCFQRWQYLKGYRWSSLPGYVNEKLVEDFVDYDLILSMVGGRRFYREFVFDGLSCGLANPFEEISEQVILGDNDFILKVKREYLGGGSLREQPSYRTLVVGVLEPGVVVGCVADTLGVNKKNILARLGDGVVRGIVSDLLYSYSNLTQAEIGKLLGGIDYTGVSQLRRRLKKRMAEEKRIVGQYKKAEHEVQKLLSSVKI